jgi:hypothetical protein
VVRCPLLRDVVSRILVVGILSVSFTAIVEASTDTLCERPHHDCATTVLTACCCQPQPAGTTALSVFAETWSSVTKLHWNSVSWIADAVALEHTVDAVVAVNLTAAPFIGPSFQSLRPGESSPVLRI